MDKDELRKKLREKINGKQFMRVKKEVKEAKIEEKQDKDVSDALKTLNIPDIETFKQNMKNFDMETLKQELVKQGIDVDKYLKMPPT